MSNTLEEKLNIYEEYQIGLSRALWLCMQINDPMNLFM